MKLNVREWGTGDRTAVLLHGITSDSGSWWRFGPDLAARGYHVLAPDLRGHGLSPRGEYGPEAWAGDLLESVPSHPELALGHSLGGLVLAVAIERLLPARAVYEDPAWRLRSERHAQAAEEFVAQKGWGREQVVAANPRWPAGGHRSQAGGPEPLGSRHCCRRPQRRLLGLHAGAAYPALARAARRSQ